MRQWLIISLMMSLIMVLMPVAKLFAEQAGTSTPGVPVFQVRVISGWTVYVSDVLIKNQNEDTAVALTLLQSQLDDIIRTVPKLAVAQMQVVPMWFNPEYPGIKPRAEYHPGVEWLQEQGRSTKLYKGIEYYNIKNFAKKLSACRP